MRPLVVKVTAGQEEEERTDQGFTVASAALAAGAEVSLWLTGEAAWFGTPGRARTFILAHATPLEEMLDLLIAEGTVTVCAQCAVRRGISADDLLDGVRLAGSEVFAEEILRPDAQALVY